MKLKTLFITTLATALSIFACTTKPGYSSERLSEKINLTVAGWQNMRSTADLNPESINSWIPESGIRGRYQIAKQVLSKSVLESIIGEKAFLSGPHGEDMDYNSARKFGRYNPKFLTNLHKSLSSLFSSKIFVDNAQALYDSELKQYLRTYYLAYEVAANAQEVMDGYMSILATEPKKYSESVFLSEPSLFLQESFRDFAESIEQEGYYVYEGFVCPGFWVRRSIDGTADEFFELLTLALRTFDPEFLSSK